MENLDPSKAARDLLEQLTSEKRRIGFLVGAGTSVAVGLPDIKTLTETVLNGLGDEHKEKLKQLVAKLGAGASVEDVLERVRLCRLLIGTSEDEVVYGITGASEAKELDSAICRNIAKAVAGEPPKGLTPHLTFAKWIRSFYSVRLHPVEIFTTNYDLLLERALETLEVPYFDGFIGSEEPFFCPTSIATWSATMTNWEAPPPAWTRLWKIHGSINWVVTKKGNREQVVRRSIGAEGSGAELVIFPSRDKYSDSRKRPFIAFQDRFREFVSHGETLLIVIGFSWNDSHINDVILTGLRSNSRLAVHTLLFDEPGDSLLTYASEYRNFRVSAPATGCLGGQKCAWRTDSKEEDMKVYWDPTTSKFTLGDFWKFASFLEESVFLEKMKGDSTEPSGAPAETPNPSERAKQ